MQSHDAIDIAVKEFAPKWPNIEHHELREFLERSITADHYCLKYAVDRAFKKILDKVYLKKEQEYRYSQFDKKTHDTLLAQAKLKEEQVKRDAETKVQLEKFQKAVERRLLGEGARDLVFTAKHQEEVDYGKILGEDWRFDSDGTTMYSRQTTVTGVFAEKSEYLCLGFPQKVIERLQAEVNEHLNKTPNAVLRVERILLDRLSRISIRKEYQRLSKSTIRQAFKINRKALNKAQLLWPKIFKYK